MANNNKNGYSTGSSDPFDLFDQFDALNSAPTKVQKTESKPAEIIKPAEPEAEKPVKKTSAEKEEKKAEPAKKNPLFAIICAVLCAAIVLCGSLSVINIGKVKKASLLNGDDSAIKNIYTEMSARFDAAVFPAGIQASYIKAFSSNHDLVGWLYIPGTAVNTPIVQSKDNSYYLRHNFFGSNTNYGTAYADSRCSKDTLSSNLVIYGHNMPSGTHFYDVSRYEDIEWYKKHPVIKYSNLTGEYTYLVYAAFYTTAQTKYNGNYFFNYILPTMGPVSLGGYIEQIDERAIYKTGIDANSSDKLITLSTCTHTLDAACGVDLDGRLVVVGRLLRAGESEEVDTSNAKDNPDYLRPLIWYKSTGKKNTHTVVKWIPTAE